MFKYFNTLNIGFIRMNIMVRIDKKILYTNFYLFFKAKNYFVLIFIT